MDTEKGGIINVMAGEHGDGVMGRDWDRVQSALAFHKHTQYI